MAALIFHVATDRWQHDRSGFKTRRVDRWTERAYKLFFIYAEIIVDNVCNALKPLMIKSSWGFGEQITLVLHKRRQMF
jgi:hypothetical protein